MQSENQTQSYSHAFRILQNRPLPQPFHGQSPHGNPSHPTRHHTEKISYAVPSTFSADQPNLARETAIISIFTQRVARGGLSLKKKLNQFFRVSDHTPVFRDAVTGKEHVVQYSGITRSHAIPLSLPEHYERSDEVAVFLELSRLNH
jgi:hypothetical protein